MKNQTSLTIAETDYEKLIALAGVTHTKAGELLEEELSRASIVADEKLPTDVVAMNSLVNFKDMETGKESQVTLVYPKDADMDENKLSILAPIGSALIGLKVGQVIKWPIPNGKEAELKVTSVLQQKPLITST